MSDQTCLLCSKPSRDGRIIGSFICAKCMRSNQDIREFFALADRILDDKTRSRYLDHFVEELKGEIREIEEGENHDTSI